MRASIQFLAVFPLGLALCFGCGDDNAPSAVADTVTKLIGPEGGTLELSGGGKVEIPSGALLEAVEIKVSKLDLEDVADVPSNLEASGKPYAFEPHGQHFERPIKIEVPFDDGADELLDVRPIKLNDEQDENWRTIVGSDKSDGKVSFETTSFSVILAARPRRGSGVITLPDGAIVVPDAGRDATTDMDAALADAGVDAALADATVNDAATDLDAALADADVDAALADASFDGGDGGLPDIDVAQLALGQNHSCARMVDGTVRCWGLGQFGRLGNGTMNDSVIPVQVSGVSGATSIAVGEQHGCALLSNTTVRCWGPNDHGELGDGTNMQRLTSVAVNGIAGVVEIAAGRFHTCARLGAGTVRCWGYNAWGQIGNGNIIDQNLPQLVTGLTNVAQLALGNGTSCARLVDGVVQCWGYNNEGELGDGTIMQRMAPTMVNLGGVAVEIATGTNTSCARMVDTTVRCWGFNDLGQVGDGSSGNQRATPVTVSGLTGAAALALASNHSCALLSDMTVRCWGYNQDGQLNDGTQMQRNTPVTVMDVVDAVEIAAGNAHTCARLIDNTVQCWGNNIWNQLGPFAL